MSFYWFTPLTIVTLLVNYTTDLENLANHWFDNAACVVQLFDTVVEVIPYNFDTFDTINT